MRRGATTRTRRDCCTAIGVLVLAPPHASRLRRHPGARGRSEPRSIVERRLLNTDHGEIAATCSELWGLPDSIVDAVAAHARFRADEGRELDRLDVNSALGIDQRCARAQWLDEPLYAEERAPKVRGFGTKGAIARVARSSGKAA